MAGRRKASTAPRILPRHAAFYWGAAAGVAAVIACLFLFPAYAVAIGANAMFITYLTLVAVEFPSLTATFLQQRPDDVDSPVAVIFGITILVVAVAVGSLFLALNGAGPTDVLGISVGVVSVVLGWFTIHTLAALHYAHQYYVDAKGSTKGEVVGGLKFPDPEPPDGGAFLYFAYVLGMTAQVADVAVSSSAMRRLVTIHGVFSFFFNTVIVAATVNVVVTITGS